MNQKKWIVLISLIFSVLVLFHCGQQPEPGENIKVVMLGFDGASWATIDPLIDNGKLPFLKQLKEECAWANFKTFKPTKSNVVWTSIASGKTMLKHGIMDFVYLKKKGIKVPFSKSNRLAPMLWQILDLYQKRSIVLNWWVSHPPDKINGVMVSDHFRKITTTRPEFLDEYRSSVYPPEYFDRLKKFGDMNRKYLKVLKKTGLPEYISWYYRSQPRGDHQKVPVLNVYPRLIKYDATIESVSGYLYQRENFDFFATYFRFPDIIQHFVIELIGEDIKTRLKEMDFDAPESKDFLSRTTRKISDLMEPAYQYMERILKAYISNPKYKNAYFFIMSDHGFSLTPEGYDHYNLPAKFDPPDGFLIIKGPMVKRGKIEKVSIYDITPTILNLYDLPVGENMDGRVLREVFNLKRKTRYRLYKLKKEKILQDERYNRESLKELEALGYID